MRQNTIINFVANIAGLFTASAVNIDARERMDRDSLRECLSSSGRSGRTSAIGVIRHWITRTWLGGFSLTSLTRQQAAMSVVPVPVQKQVTRHPAGPGTRSYYGS